MSTGMIILNVVIILVVLLIAFVAKTYNTLVSLKNRVQDQWAQVDVVLKRRADLIPNLVETVKGYASHENDTLEAVIAARNQAVSATDAHSEMEANNVLTEALGRLFAIAEAYPDLKANTNFMELQRTLQETEDKITYARQFYNDTVMSFNNKIEMFPSNIIASMFHFKAEDLFVVDNEEAKKAVKVDFGNN